MTRDETHLADSTLESCRMTFAMEGFCIIDLRPSRTMGVLSTIFWFACLASLPAASSSTARCWSSSVSATKALRAMLLICFGSVVWPTVERGAISTCPSLEPLRQGDIYSLPLRDDDTMATSPANAWAASGTDSPLPPPPPRAFAADAKGFAGERASRVTGRAVTAILCNAAETKTREAFIVPKV